jgi:hypothetical protein
VTTAVPDASGTASTKVMKGERCYSQPGEVGNGAAAKVTCSGKRGRPSPTGPPITDCAAASSTGRASAVSLTGCT